MHTCFYRNMCSFIFLAMALGKIWFDMCWLGWRLRLNYFDCLKPCFWYLAWLSDYVNFLMNVILVGQLPIWQCSGVLWWVSKQLLTEQFQKMNNITQHLARFRINLKTNRKTWNTICGFFYIQLKFVESS